MPAKPDAQSKSGSGEKLSKQLGLWDVYCVSTGAMFSSGFFLLPGIATASAGPSTVLAYFIAGLLIIPSMLCMAELSTALPRAGGTYYFLDRSMGPAVGAIGGLGSWLALVLKSGFALLGMGAYLAIMPGVAQFFAPESGTSLWMIKIVAVVLALLFGIINIFGAKESTRLQSVLVMTLLAVLGFFVIQGLWYVFSQLPEGELQRQYSPFMHEERGVAGLISTVGLVFVSYAGLTKVASVSEEVRRPDRNLPLGMFLSLATATATYVVGVFIMVAVLDPAALREDYTPVATAAEAFFTWLPAQVGLILVVVAALAAFASTGNAGVMAASRYPLAMARDKLAPERLGKLGHFGTPTASIILTTALMIAFVLAFDAEGVAKLASAFNLLVFAMVNLAVIVMRESRIESYDPGYRTPLYPWMPIAGVIISGWLITEMGWLAIGFSVGIIVVGGIWYVYYARSKVERYGAINHVFERLGRHRHEPLQSEFREIIKEKGLRDEDPFDAIVARSDVFDAEAGMTFEQVLRRAAELLAARLPLEVEEIVERFAHSGRYGGAPISHGAVLPHFRSHVLEQSELVMVRSRDGVCVSLPADSPEQDDAPDQSCEVSALLFLVSPEDNPGQHLRVLAQIASRIEEPSFIGSWQRANDEQKLKEVLLRDERFLVLHVGRDEPTQELVNVALRDLRWPEGTLIGMIRRDGQIFTPRGSTVLRHGDRLTIIGDPKGIDRIYATYVDPEQ